MDGWTLVEAFVRDHTDEAVDRLEQLTPDAVAAFLAEAPPPTARAALERMDVVSGAAALRRCEEERAASLLGALPPRVALGLLRRIGAAERARILEQTAAERAEELRRGLDYPADSAGGLMDPAVLALPHGLSVREARRRVRRHAALAADDVWVTTREGALVGAVRLRELMLSDGREPLETLTDTGVGRIAPHVGRPAVAAHPAWQSRSALPVVDAEGRLLGAIPARLLGEIRQPAPAFPGTGPVAAGLAIGELYWLTATQLVGALLGNAGESEEPR
jgi:Mg/Co/Ni transporter MgtE